MVEQNRSGKTSSAAWEPLSRRYKIRATVAYRGAIPRSTRIVEDGVTALYGDSDEGHRLAPKWKVPPHVQFVNVPTYNAAGAMVMTPELGLKPDIKAVAAFIRRYGVFLDEAFFAKGAGGVEGQEDFDHFSRRQHLHRRAWTGDATAIEALRDISSMGLRIRFAPEGVALESRDLTGFIALLFSCDHRSGATGVCANPNCQAPYFLKQRNTQKFCERSSCTEYAQRQYALTWWRREGSRRRAKRAKLQRRSTK
jgi:hypothetical protein